MPEDEEKKKETRKPIRFQFPRQASEDEIIQALAKLIQDQAKDKEAEEKEGKDP